MASMDVVELRPGDFGFPIYDYDYVKGPSIIFKHPATNKFIHQPCTLSYAESKWPVIAIQVSEKTRQHIRTAHKETEEVGLFNTYNAQVKLGFRVSNPTAAQLVKIEESEYWQPANVALAYPNEHITVPKNQPFGFEWGVGGDVALYCNPYQQAIMKEHSQFFEHITGTEKYRTFNNNLTISLVDFKPGTNLKTDPGCYWSMTKIGTQEHYTHNQIILAAGTCTFTCIPFGLPVTETDSFRLTTKGKERLYRMIKKPDGNPKSQYVTGVVRYITTEKFIIHYKKTLVRCHEQYGRHIRIKTAVYDPMVNLRARLVNSLRANPAYIPYPDENTHMKIIKRYSLALLHQQNFTNEEASRVAFLFGLGGYFSPPDKFVIEYVGHTDSRILDSSLKQFWRDLTAVTDVSPLNKWCLQNDKYVCNYEAFLPSLKYTVDAGDLFCCDGLPAKLRKIFKLGTPSLYNIPHILRTYPLVLYRFGLIQVYENAIKLAQAAAAAAAQPGTPCVCSVRVFTQLARMLIATRKHVVVSRR